MLNLIAGLWLGLASYGNPSPDFALPFYRTPGSAFSSGQASLESLVKGKVADFTTRFYLIEKDSQSFRIESHLVVRDLDLSKMVVEPKSGKVALLLQTDALWSQIQDEKGLKSWIPSTELVPDVTDLGLVLSIEDQSLLAHAQSKSPVLARALALDKFEFLDFDGAFVKVKSLKDSSLVGFLQLSRVILKVDFAQQVLLKNGTWIPFQFRQGEVARLRNSKAPLSQIQGLTTRPELGILNASLANYRLQPRSTVKIKKTEWDQWTQSDLKDHGPVYWNKSLLKKDPNSSFLSTSEILSREIFSYATHPDIENYALVSTNGVYLTTDGKLWKPLLRFQGQNLPVAIGKKGELFVGDSRSTDGGTSFHPYVNWPDLATLLESRHRRAPGHLKIIKIQPQESKRIQITVDTGVWQAQLEGDSSFGLITSWRVLKER